MWPIFLTGRRLENIPGGGDSLITELRAVVTPESQEDVTLIEDKRKLANIPDGDDALVIELRATATPESQEDVTLTEDGAQLKV